MHKKKKKKISILHFYFFCSGLEGNLAKIIGSESNNKAVKLFLTVILTSLKEKKKREEKEAAKK